MGSNQDLADVFVSTFVPTWIHGRPARQRQPEGSSLDAFRQRIFMQQVTESSNSVCYVVEFLPSVL